MNPNATAAFMAMLKQLQFVLVGVGVILVHLGMDHTLAYKYVMVGSGSVIAIGSALWGLWCSGANFWKTLAIGTQAGVNMTVAGKALAEDGTTIVAFGNGATPPKQVTQETAAEIVKDFPPTAPITKS